MITCPKCSGTKKFAPLGWIDKTCPTCNGLGTIDNVAKQEQNIIVKEVKRRAKRTVEQVDGQASGI